MIVRRAGQPDHQEVVLIVDDEPRNIELLTAMLAPDGFLFRSAESGAKALASIAEHRPDLVLLDIMMPDMDGHEVVRRIKEDAATSSIPVIMVTALDDRKSRLTSLEAGAEDFLTKPVDRAELRMRVRNLLRLKALSDQLDNQGKFLESEVRARTKDLLATQAALLGERDGAQRYLDTAQVFLVALDLHGRITLVNRYACQALGRDAADLIGSSWLDCLPERIRGGMHSSFQRLVSAAPAAVEAVAAVDPASSIQHPVVDTAGREYMVEWRTILLRDEEGRLTGTFSSGTDVTARTEAIAGLAATEERMQFALKNANVGIWDVDSADGVLHWSDTLEAQYGLAPGTFPGTFAAFIEGVHPEDRQDVLDTITEAARSGGDFSFHHRALHADGSIRWLHGAGHYQLDDSGKPLRGVGISQDITERRTLERQYQQSQKMEAVGRLAAGVAHDFNNLLTVITGFAEFVAASLPEKQAADDVAEIIKAADRAAALTQQLLAFSRQQVLHTAPVDLNELVTGMTGMITRLIGADVSVKLDLQPGLCPALADRGQIEQVLMNLVVNARDAMPDGGSILIETRNAELENSPFHEELITSGAYAMLAVTDTGIGMSKETQKRLFEPFYTTKKVGDGTGLGLSTSYGIVKQSNGHIWVYSEPGTGTTFKVYLPYSPDVQVAAAKLAPPARPELVTETLLLVEDEASVRDLTSRILREAGYRVLVAANGADARSLFERNRGFVDLVLTDVVMPGMGGPELLTHLHAENPELPVLYMSGYTEQKVAVRAGLNRGIAFLPKPFTSAELLRSVRGALAGHGIAAKTS